jgi:hypothetical protein
MIKATHQENLIDCIIVKIPVQQALSVINENRERSPAAVGEHTLHLLQAIDEALNRIKERE